MERNVGRIWLGLLILALGVAIVCFGDSLNPIDTKDEPFLIVLTQLGILYSVALVVERSLEVLIKVWRQSGKTPLEDAVRSADGEDSEAKKAKKALEEYRTGTQKRALLFGLTMGVLVSLSGVRFLGSIFAFDGAGSDNPRIDGAHR